MVTSFNYKKSTVKISIAFCLFLNPAQSFAVRTNTSTEKNMTVLFRTENSEIDNYNRTLEKHGYYRPRLVVAKDKVNTLVNLKSLAEHEFVSSGDLSEPLATYKKIISKSLDQPWPDKGRSVIFESYFRLAQIEKDQKEFWIKKAISYAYDLKPNPARIPISLIEDYEKLRKLKQFEKLAKNIDPQIIVNGSKKIKTVESNSLYRLDHFSDISFYQTKYALGKNISSTKFNKNSFGGKCQKASARFNLENRELNNVYLFSSEKCDPIKLADMRIKFIRESTLNVAKANPKPALPTLLPQKTTESVQMTSTTFGDHSMGFNQTAIKPKKRSSNKWYYIGSAVLAVTIGAMLINEDNDNSRRYEPTSRQGF